MDEMLDIRCEQEAEGVHAGGHLRVVGPLNNRLQIEVLKQSHLSPVADV